LFGFFIFILGELLIFLPIFGVKVKIQLDCIFIVFFGGREWLFWG
jgi:hypothetical protein